MLPKEKLLNIAPLSSKMSKCPMLSFLAVHAPTLSKLHNPIGEGNEIQNPGLTHSTDHPEEVCTHTLTLLRPSFNLTLTQNQITLNLITLATLPFHSVSMFKSSWSPTVLPFYHILHRTILPDLLGNEFIIPLTAWKELTALIIMLHISPGFSL